MIVLCSYSKEAFYCLDQEKWHGRFSNLVASLKFILIVPSECVLYAEETDTKIIDLGWLNSFAFVLLSEMMSIKITDFQESYEHELEKSFNAC